MPAPTFAGNFFLGETMDEVQGFNVPVRHKNQGPVTRPGITWAGAWRRACPLKSGSGWMLDELRTRRRPLARLPPGFWQQEDGHLLPGPPAEPPEADLGTINKLVFTVNYIFMLTILVKVMIIYFYKINFVLHTCNVFISNK